MNARQIGKILGFWETYKEDAMCAWSPNTPRSAASSELFELPPSIFVVCMRMETLIPQSTKSHRLTQNPENRPYKMLLLSLADGHLKFGKRKEL